MLERWGEYWNKKWRTFGLEMYKDQHREIDREIKSLERLSTCSSGRQDRILLSLARNKFFIVYQDNLSCNKSSFTSCLQRTDAVIER